jgi:hypothetical protein
LSFIAQHTGDIAARRRRLHDIEFHVLMAIVRTALAWAAPAAEGLRASVACASWVRALCNAAATVPTRTTTLLDELSPLIGPVASARYCRFSLAEWRGRPPPAGASSSGDDDSQASLGPRVRRPVRCPVTERSAGYANRAAFVFENPRHYLDRMALVAEWNFLAYVTSLCYWVNASQKNARLWSTIRLPVLDDGNTCCASTGTRPCRFSQHPHTYAIGGDASRAVPRGDAHFATRNGLPDRLLGYVLEQALVGFDETERGTPWVLDLYSGTNSARRAVQVGAAPAGVRVVSVNACDIVDGPATHRPDLYVDIVAELLARDDGLERIVDAALAFLHLTDSRGTCCWRSLVLVWASPPCETYSPLNLTNERLGASCHRDWRRAQGGTKILSSPPLSGPAGFLARLHDAALQALLRQIPRVLARTA